MRHSPESVAPVRIIRPAAASCSPRQAVRWAGAVLVVLVLGAPSRGWQAPARAPVPAPADVEKAEALVRDVYKADLAAAIAPSKQQELAAKFIEEGAATDDDPAARFALLKMAQQMAAEVGDAALIVKSLDEAAKHFEFDAPAAKRAALMKAAEGPRTSAVARTFAEACLGLMDQAVKAEQFDAAMDYGRAAYTAANSAKDPAFVAGIVARGRGVVALRAEYEKAAEAIGTLARQPDDPEANLVAGRYACLLKEDWAAGLPRLARCADSDLKAAAEKDLARPGDAPGQIAVADAWWELGQKQTGTERAALLNRAAFWYRRAQAEATGLDKAKATSRLAEVRGFTAEKPQPKPDKPDKPQPKPGQSPPKTLEAPQGQYADLLKEIDLKKHRIVGDWQTRAGKLLGSPGTAPGAAIRVPVVPHGDYDLQIELTRTAGDGMIGVVLPVGGRRCLAGLDCRPGVHGIDTIGGQRADNNASTAKGVLSTGRQYALEISVTSDGGDASITVNLDGRPLFFYRGPARDLDLHKEFTARGAGGIGLIARSGVVFHSLKLRMKSGKAALVE